MESDQVDWEKWSAIGQIAGAAATFLAVLVSLYLSIAGRRPRLRIVAGERMAIGGLDDGRRYLMFQISNRGERPVHIKTLGWRTGYFRWGLASLKFQNAIQQFDAGGVILPVEIQPGAEITVWADMANVLRYAAEKTGRPFFSRDWPCFGRRRTRIQAVAFTADGYIVRQVAEKSLRMALAAAEAAPPQ